MSFSSDALNSRLNSISHISTPLKFFALALFIVETIIALIAYNEKTTPELMVTLSYLATFMFVLVVMMVVLLGFYREKLLIASDPSQLREVAVTVQEKQENLSQLLQEKQEIINRLGGIPPLAIEATPLENLPPVLTQRIPGDA